MTNQQDSRPCRLCSSPLNAPPIINMQPFPKAAQFYPREDEFAEDTGIVLDVFQCPSCGLVQLKIDPVDYFKEVITAAVLSPHAKQTRLKEMNAFVDRFDLKGKKALEIGSAKGEMLDVMVEAGLDPTGLEYAPQSVEHALKHGRNMHRGYIDDFVPVSKADVFFSYNYLEHQPDTKAFIQSIYRVTTPDAIGYVTVPNLEYLLASKCLYEFVADHLVYFTKSTLSLAFEMNGFEVLSCQTINNDNDIEIIVRKRRNLDLSPYVAEVDKLATELFELVDRYKRDGKKIAVWGAGHRTLALLAISRLTEIAFIVDSADFKQGKYSPVTFNKIVSPGELEASDVDAVIIMVPGLYPQEVLKTVRGFDRKLEAYILKGNELVAVDN
ncbi:methyltransferase domain-containing protein [Magnetovibrio sp.]|uniref:methyltransferase domain-containing protein n=1 Tax=Magnetovibrio sp. TaxID=2024836 RepID=UPI002F94B155